MKSDPYYAWLKRRRLALGKSIILCQRRLNTEATRGQRYSSASQRMRRMVAYYRNRLTCLVVEEQRYYYKGS